MNRLSKRLRSLISFVSNEDSLVDVGCDHGYLSIYLKENNLCKSVICSDINNNALNSAISNIKRYNLKIECYLSDGLNKVPMEGINTIVISGMGTSTIISILENKEKLKYINKIILQSNNNHEELRRYMNQIGYYLKEEKYIKDKGKWYISMLFLKSENVNSVLELKYGFLDNDYGNYLLDSYKSICKRIPKNRLDYKKYQEKIKEIETIIN